MEKCQVAEARRYPLLAFSTVMEDVVSGSTFSPGMTIWFFFPVYLSGSKTKFVLVGPIDKESPDHIPHKNISEWENSGLIQYLGDRKDIREILFLSDIFVFPSYYREGIPKVLLEAGSMGKPLVAVDNVGTREIVEDGVNGFLVEAQKAQDLLEAIIKLVENPDLRQKLGAAARQKVLQQFSDKIVISKTMEVYNLIINSQETITKEL